jgi:uncharacterized membrane protein YeaQ/YmgE (transglycosylase-associated protein family)
MLLVAIIAWIVVGGVTGWLASLAMRGSGLGVVGDVIVGIIGSMIGGIITSLLGGSGVASIWNFIIAFIGAAVLLLLLRLLGIGTRGPPRP